MTQPKILIISGSLREGSYNRKLVTEAARLFGGTATMGDLDLPLYNGDVESGSGIPQSVRLLSDQIASADAVAISTPEYNQSLSGVLKNALDWVSRVEGNPWMEKPVAIMSAAAGRAGGARAQYALRLALNPFQPRLLTGPEVMVARPEAEFDTDGQLIGEVYLRALSGLTTKLRNDVSKLDQHAA